MENFLWQTSRVLMATGVAAMTIGGCVILVGKYMQYRERCAWTEMESTPAIGTSGKCGYDSEKKLDVPVNDDPPHTPESRDSTDRDTGA